MTLEEKTKAITAQLSRNSDLGLADMPLDGPLTPGLSQQLGTMMTQEEAQRQAAQNSDQGTTGLDALVDGASEVVPDITLNTFSDITEAVGDWISGGLEAVGDLFSGSDSAQAADIPAAPLEGAAETAASAAEAASGAAEAISGAAEAASGAGEVISGAAEAAGEVAGAIADIIGGILS